MLSNLWKALWGTKPSIEETRQAIERDAQRLSQFPWKPENHATLRSPTQEQRERNVTPVYGSGHSFSVVQSRTLPTIYQEDSLNERHSQPTARSLPRVRSRRDEEEDNEPKRRKRRRGAKKQRQQHNNDIIAIPSSSSSSAVSLSAAPEAQQQQGETTDLVDDSLPADDNTASIASSSHPQQQQQPSTATLSREPVIYPQRDLHSIRPFSTNETELKHIIRDMLRPGVWDTLSGDIVQQWIEVPYVLPCAEDLFGSQGRLMQLIKEKATGVEITVEFPRIVLKGPQIKVNRVADTVGALITPFGRKKQGSVNLLCTGPQLASKVAKWKEHVGDVIDVLVKEDMVRISIASVVINKNAKVTLDQVRDGLLHLLGSLTPEHQPESFICNDYQLLSREERKTTMIVSPDQRFGLGEFIGYMAGYFERCPSMHTPHRPKVTVLKSKTRMVPKNNPRRTRKMKKETIHPPSNLKDMIPPELLDDFFGHLDVVGVDLTYIFRPRRIEPVEIPVTYQGFRIF